MVQYQREGKEIEDLTAYVYQVALNVARRQVRLQPEPAFSPASLPPDQDRALMEIELQRMIGKALSGINEKDRNLLINHDVLGTRLGDLAGIHKTTRLGLAMRLHRIRKQVRERCERLGIGPR